MTTLRSFSLSLALAASATLVACATGPKSADIERGIRQSLDAANLKDVSVHQDQDKGVLTLGGQTKTQEDRMQAETLARALAGREVVANQIAVVPQGNEADAKKVNSDLDKGIEQNLDAALIQTQLRKGLKYEVKNGVVTLSGDVASQSLRAEVERVAASVPNVQQVVNTLQVRNQKATSSN